MALEKELETYKREFEHLREHEGKFVLIKDDRVLDWYDTYRDALKAGYEKFGLVPFMVKQILSVEPVHTFSREIICRI